MAYDLESRDRERDPQEAGATAASPGKASRTQRLGASAAAPDDRDREKGKSADYAFYPDWDEQGGTSGQPTGEDDPFALHIPPTGEGDRSAASASPQPVERKAPTP